jgi:hypothetical protein
VLTIVLHDCLAVILAGNVISLFSIDHALQLAARNSLFEFLYHVDLSSENSLFSINTARIATTKA